MAEDDEDDDKIEYGKTYVFDIRKLVADENELVRREEYSIWPHWNQGVPTRLGFKARSDWVAKGGVMHRPRSVRVTVDLEWSTPHALTAIAKTKSLLPPDFSTCWNGVYRLFVPNSAIPRIGDTDETGTLYIGRGGSKRGWSTVRSRVADMAKAKHHAAGKLSDVLRSKFPWETLAVHWAFTKDTTNYRGEVISGAVRAEALLLRCYRDSFGELPPFNEKV